MKAPTPAAPAAPTPAAPAKRVKIKVYKIMTSLGRKLEGDLIELPAAEADSLIAAGHAEEKPVAG